MGSPLERTMADHELNSLEQAEAAVQRAEQLVDAKMSVAWLS